MNEIVNKEKFENIKRKFQDDGPGKIHVLSDFDRTLTKAYVNGEEVPSVISILRDGSYLTSDYAAKAHELYNKYRPIEKDPNISMEEKKKLMEEWWMTHFDLLIKSGLKKDDVKKVVKSEKIKLRDGFPEFAELLRRNNIPLVILSSAGLGEESILMKLQYEGIPCENIHVISNSFEWDREGRAISVRKPIVHGANKDEAMAKNFPEIFREVENRKNVILLGDSPEDIGMAERFDYDNILKVGFFNDQTKDRENSFREVYDILIRNDSSLDFVNEFLRDISEK